MSIPKGCVILMDVDSSEEIELISVEGGLLFLPDEDPDHVRELHAHYIMVKNGFFQAGTKKHPYTSNLNIVMHGHEEDPKMNRLFPTSDFFFNFQGYYSFKDLLITVLHLLL